MSALTGLGLFRPVLARLRGLPSSSSSTLRLERAVLGLGLKEERGR